MQFAERLGVERSYLSQIERGRVPSGKVLSALRVMEVEARVRPADESVVAGPRQVPVVEWRAVAALVSSDGVGKRERGVVTDCADPLAFGIVIGVDCMGPEYAVGDIATVMPCADPRNNCLVITNMVRGGAVFRRWSPNDGKGASFRLTASRKEYRPIDLTFDDVHWIYPVWCVHKPTW